MILVLFCEQKVQLFKNSTYACHHASHSGATHDIRVTRGTAEELGPYTLSSALRVCLDAAKGMSYLHSADLIHRDLKSMNIMVSEKLQGKVADYGESRKKSADLTMTSTGTPLWMAPEVSRNERYDSKADMYSFGIILYEVCKRRLPYADMKDLTAVGLAVKVAMQGLRPTIEDGWHPGLQSLMRDCYGADSNARPTFFEAELRLRKVIEELGADPSDRGQVGQKRAATDVRDNFLGCGLWQRIQTVPDKIVKGRRIGKVRLLDHRRRFASFLFHHISRQRHEQRGWH